MTGKLKAASGVQENWPNMTNLASGWTPLVEANRLAVGNWMKANEAILNGALALSKELAEFAQARLREDFRVYEQLAKCQNPREAAECQREYTKTATAQYLDHANKLANLMTKLTAATFALPRHSAAEASETVEKKAK